MFVAIKPHSPTPKRKKDRPQDIRHVGKRGKAIRCKPNLKWNDSINERKIGAGNDKIEPHISSFRAIPNDVKSVRNRVWTMRTKKIQGDFT